MPAADEMKNEWPWVSFPGKKVIHYAWLVMDLDETRADDLEPHGEVSLDLVNDSDEDLKARSAPVPVVWDLPVFRWSSLWTWPTNSDRVHQPPDVRVLWAEGHTPRAPR